MNNIFSDNLKKFRLAKGLTQEQVAEKLNVNSQTVSRWECGTTLPDVLTLPELARLYEVTVDDFYKKNSVAYENYAQRLSSVYEQSHDPEDFMRCRAEYLKLMKEGSRYILYIPADLAFGSQSVGYIPANAVLVYDVELIEVID